MTAPANQATPPLPALSGVPQAESTTPNEWRALVTSAPIFSDAMLLVATKPIPPAARSPFRTGGIFFDRDGIKIVGMAMKPFPLWMAFTGLIAMIPNFAGVGIMFAKKQLGLSDRAAFTIAGIGVGMGLLGAFVPLLFQRLHDKKRVEATLCLGWESLHAVVVDPNLRCLMIIFRPIGVANKNEKPFHGLPLARLPPATVAGIEITLQHFAPNAIFVRRDARKTMLLPVCIGIVIGLLACVGILMVFSNSRFGTP